MARVSAVWGIDIGQCALKALRCRAHDSDPDKLITDSFDFIEYPKILSQPDADADKLVHDALTQFISRNSLAGDHVAISVSGQSGLARFIKLPPVESKKIPDIVKYEARQQIPFALEDVVWDYQQMAGGSENDGFVLETEVGLFAMKRDQVYRAITPLNEAGIAVDLIQLTPLAIFNYVVFDQFSELPPIEDYDPESPPPSTLVLSIGTDTTDLVVTNGFRVWQRSIPIGGSHFTKALTKELRLTFSKAEHLKRHAKQAENAKAVFQAMRPVFSDLLTEVQRSIGFFNSLDTRARIDRMLALGNAMKLPGLRRYLSQNLEQELQPIKQFANLEGPTVLQNPQFATNLLSFGTAYGLCLQGLGKANIRTNLLPKEIVTERLIKSKKPWAVAALAATLLGCAINFAGHWVATSSADESRFQSAFSQVQQVQSTSSDLINQRDEVINKRNDIDLIGKNLTGNVHGRLYWLEVLQAIDASLPKHEPPVDEKGEPVTVPIAERRELHIESVDCEYMPDVGPWFAFIDPKYKAWHGVTVPPPGANTDDPYAEGPSETPYSAPAPPSPDGTAAPGDGKSGPGWIIEIRGYHYHNENATDGAGQFVFSTLLKSLEEGSVKIAYNPGEQPQTIPISDLGIHFPVLVQNPKPYLFPIEDLDKIAEMRNAEIEAAKNGAQPAAANRGPNQGEFGGQLETPMVNLQKYDFVVQFCWQPTTREQREQLAEERKLAAEQAAKEKEAAAAAAAAESPESGVESPQ